MEVVNIVYQNTNDVDELQPPPPVIEDSSDSSINNINNTLQEPNPNPSSKREEFVNIFYKDGQSLDNCLIANRF